MFQAIPREYWFTYFLSVMFPALLRRHWLTYYLSLMFMALLREQQVPHNRSTMFQTWLRECRLSFFLKQFPRPRSGNADSLIFSRSVPGPAQGKPSPILSLINVPSLRNTILRIFLHLCNFIIIITGVNRC